MKITCTAVVVLIQTLQCLASDDSPFQLTNKDTGFCLVKTNNDCNDVRWTTSDRLLVPQRKKCLGAQGKSVGSEISLYDCDETSELQKWECRNGTVLALKDQELYIELTADNTAVLSKTTGPNNHLTIRGTSSGACTRTYRELFTIGGNAAGMPCMFPFHYKDQWYTECTTLDSSENRLWCAVETKYQTERWGFCPINSTEGWNKHPTTGVYYQLNTHSALTWPQAETSCKQQGASLLSITDPHEQAYVIALLELRDSKLWTGLIQDREHGWKWSDGRPYHYMKWDSGHPIPNPGHNCGILDPAVQYSWQSSACSKKLGYICYSKEPEKQTTQAVETRFCSRPWIPYNGHCFHINRTQKTWSDAQRDCHNGGGDLVSIRNVEDQSFVISQLGYESTDELWIGLNDRKKERLFEWIDHSTVTFTSWEFGKPASATNIKNCVMIRGENGNWVDNACEEKHGFICMKMGASTPTRDQVEQDEGCKSGWRRHGSYCYFIGTQTKTFDEARDDCKSSDSYLADVSNGVDNAFLVSLVGMRPEKHFWIGLSNQKHIDAFVWTNTDLVKFTHWNAQMPGHQQGCVAMTTGIFAGLWDVLPCTSKKKYICKHLAEGAGPTPVPPTSPSTKCEDGWTRIESRFFCFKMFYESSSKRKTWYEARDYCRAIGGDLLSIHSADEFSALPRRYGPIWIGLSAPDPVTGYIWSDGSPLQFQDWEEGEPNYKNNVESCVELHGNRKGSWNDVHCELYRGWLCQIRTGLTPKPTPDPVTPDYNTTSDGWLEWNGNQYYFMTWSLAMEEARQYCQKRHSDLVTINSEAENVFLWKQISRNERSFWIGLTVDLDRTYQWIDGSPVVFQKWDENQPDFVNNDENCVAMTYSLGFWHDYNCGMRHGVICKRSGSPLANATVAPTVPPKGGCPQNWRKFDSKCYNIINNQRETWEGARTQCKAMGGNLASIISADVQVFLKGSMAEAPNTDLWIGLHKAYRIPFYWTDGQPLRFTGWDSTVNYYSDDYSTKQCAVMNSDPEFNFGQWIKKSCNDTNGYVCHQSLDPSLPDSPEPTTHINYVKILNDSIKVVTQPMTWTKAKEHCEADGANLASLRNQWSQAYIEMLTVTLKSPLWIGLNKEQTGGYFRYAEGWRLTITNWDRREPSSDRSCVYVHVDGKWRTADCNQEKNFTCMKSTDMPPTESSQFPGFCPDDPEENYTRRKSIWISFKGFCYLILTYTLEWPEASANCVKHGGTLASIEDPSEQDFIQSNIKMFEDNFGTFWIGLYKTHRGVWQWLDKTAMDYTNWVATESGGRIYGSIRTENGKWLSDNGRTRKAFICKTSKILRQAPPTAAHPIVDPPSHGHILTVFMVITVIAIGAGIILFLFKKSGRHIPIPAMFTTFSNPLFFNNDHSQPNLVDTNW